MFDKEVGLLVKFLDKEDVDLFVDTDGEYEAWSVAEMFDEDVGRLVKFLDKEDLDLFVDTNDEYKVCSVE